MENNNGKGIFYGVIGVATLIVAIIGATFAYFTATTRSGQLITGSAATASLDVKVDRLTGYSEGEGAATATDAKYVMVPQLDVALGEALKGSDVTGNKACIDANGSLVCEIYKIRVANNGSAAISVSGKIDFVAYGALDAGLAVGEDGTQIQASADTLMNHLKWARLVDPTTAALTSTTDKTLLPVNPSEMTGRYQVAAADAADAIPNSLLRYDSVMYTGKDAGVYEVLPNGTTRTFASTTGNQYLFGINVGTPTTGQTFVDVLGQTAAAAGQAPTSTTVTGAHGAHTDLIDPTNDLTADYALATDTNLANDGSVYLAAKGQDGDAKVFYIVVWISENNQPQNDYDFGTFAGQVTFNSSGGTGASSTFTSAYAGA